MKVRRLFFGALGVMALASVTVFGATSSAHAPPSGSRSCKAVDRHRGAAHRPGRAARPRAAGRRKGWPSPPTTRRSAPTSRWAQDDTQLTPALATTKTAAIIASNAVAVVGPVRQPGGRGGRSGSRNGRAGGHLGLGDATRR